MPETPPQLQAQEVPLPDCVRVTHAGANLVLEIRWFDGSYVFMLAALILWACFAVLWLSLKLVIPPVFPRLRFEFLLPLITLVFAPKLVYSTLAGFLNRTRVTIGDGAVDVRHGPVPWLGSKRVEAIDIAQVFGEQVRLRGNFMYRVEALTQQGRRIRLVSPVARRDVALYLEQEIEKALGIKDEEMPYELKRQPPPRTF